METDLELIDTNDLIRELAVRFPSVVFIAGRRPPNEEHMVFTHGGEWPECIKLMRGFVEIADRKASE